MPLESVRLEGLDRLYAKFGRLESNQLLRRPMEQSTVTLMGDMKPYPPAIPTSKYRRTRTLGRRWTKRVTVSSAGVVGIVGNNTTYAPWVQSERFQARIHRGRWQTDRDVMERNRDRIVGYFRTAIRQALGG